jgi:hypothetical protein
MIGESRVRECGSSAPHCCAPKGDGPGRKRGQNIRKRGKDARCCPCFAALVLFSSRPSSCTGAAVRVVSLKSGGRSRVITIEVNGASRQINIEPDTPLLWVLRDMIGLTGTKFGCGIAQCGACTVHVNGTAMRSCSVPIGTLDGAKIVTIEGLSPDNNHPVQRAWIEEGVQAHGCGNRREYYQYLSLWYVRTSASRHSSRRGHDEDLRRSRCGEPV